MKYLIIPLIFLIGCSDDSSKKIHDLQNNLHDVQFDLDSCNARLKSINDSAIPYQEPQQPAEPECSEENLNTVYKDGKLLATCAEVDETGCGLTAKSCIDGYEYFCLTNVKLGSDTKKVCN